MRHSQRAMVQALLSQSAVTANELCAATGLPEPIVASVAADLKRSGWLKATEQTPRAGSSGAPAFTLASDAAYSFGVDLGGTKIAAAIADFTGRIVAELTEPTDSRGEHHIGDQITAVAHKLALAARIDVAKLQSVTVGVPGAIDPATGRISLVPNIKGLADFDVLQHLRNQFGPVIALENDVNLAMLGEQTRGCARGCRNAAFLSLGTGAGLGLIIDGKLVRGASGAAGEIAHLPIGRDPTSLAALSTGAFELEVGSIGILERYRLEGRASIETVRDVFRLLHEGDQAAEAVLDQTARSIALAVTALQSILDLELVVFGGSIGVRPELVERVQRAIVTVFSRPVRTAPSQLGSRAGLVGAVCAAVDGLHDYLFGRSVVAGDALREACNPAPRKPSLTNGLNEGNR